MAATSEPWPVSVIANAPGISRIMMPGSHLSWCSLVPRCSTARAEQAPLHARLDLQGRVGGDELLEPGDGCRRGRPAPPRPSGTRGARRLVDEEVELAEDALAVLGHALALDAAHGLGAGQGARLLADVGPAAKQLFAECRHVDGGVGGV